MAADSGTLGETVDGRERILSSALHLFATRGYGQTSTKSIGEHAGVATGLLFYHFDSKEDLLRAVLAERAFDPELRAVAANLSSDPAEALTVVGGRLVRLARMHADYVTVLLGSREIVPKAYASFQAHLESLCTALGDHLGSTLKMDPSHARATAQTFVGSLFATELVLPRRGSDRRMVKATVEVVLNGAGH